MNLVGVPADLAADLWPAVQEYVLEALNVYKEHRWTVDDILKAVVGRDMQLWVIADPNMQCVVVTEILNFPRARECNIFLVAGGIPGGWDEPLQKMAEWAAEQGCTHISTCGRPGVARKMKALGWEVRQTYCVKEI